MADWLPSSEHTIILIKPVLSMEIRQSRKTGLKETLTRMIFKILLMKDMFSAYIFS